MGAIDVPQRPSGGSRGRSPGPVKKKRHGIRIDMTPMVDIAFLLLIFYMVSTAFSMPQSLELNLPPKNNNKLIVKESKLLELWVNSEGKVFWYHNNPDKHKMELPEQVLMSKLQELLVLKINEVEKLVTVVKIDPECRYDVMVRIVDDIQQVERKFKRHDPEWSYRFSFDDITEWEIEQISIALELNS